MTVIRRPAVAGAFYSGERDRLAADVRGYLSAVPPQPADLPVPKALIAPHAGFVYSGPVAATAYARLAPAKDRIEKVVLLGPCHRVAVRGLAASTADAWRTPLGDVRLDRTALAELEQRFAQVSFFDATHTAEHSLEVHLPFLQEVLGDFRLLPFVVGDASGAEVADVLEAAWGGPETLVVISSDLSHYLDYETARKSDGAACKSIEALDPDGLDREQACGRIPVRGLLTLARRKGLGVTTLDLRNSGDTAGSKDRVVGYGSWAFFEPEGGLEKDNSGGSGDFETRTRTLLDTHGAVLLRLAAQTIKARLGGKKSIKINLNSFPPDLRDTGACFITLKKNGKLRGCIGTVEAHRPLAVDVAENAISAGFKDPRFKPLSPKELAPEAHGDLHLSLSVLSPHWPIDFADEEDLLAQLRPGIDGLIIADGGKRSLFLPSVWRELPDKKQFLTHLKRKAGLPADHWSDTFRAERFIAEELGASDVGDPADIWT